ncbi:MAG TPA: hypothetical protein VI248_00645 [Kineosporiaceae bacterium]
MTLGESLPADAGFRTEYTVYGYEVSPRGHLRPSALSRFAQQVAADELTLLAGHGVRTEGLSWVVRRNVLHGWRRIGRVGSLQFVRRITAVGSCWLESCTEVLSAGRPTGAAVRAFWVQLDAASGRPAPLDPMFERLCLAAGRDTDLIWRSELRGLPAAGFRCELVPVRPADFDALGHVNNAVVLDLVEHLAPDADGLVLEYDASINWGTPAVAVHSRPAPGGVTFRLTSVDGTTRFAAGVLRDAAPATAAGTGPLPEEAAG